MIIPSRADAITRITGEIFVKYEMSATDRNIVNVVISVTELFHIFMTELMIKITTATRMPENACLTKGMS